MFEKRKRLKREKRLKSKIEESGLFDKIFYLKTYADIRTADILPIDHYVKYGIKEDRKPNEHFDPVWYREFYADVKADGVYPLEHYILFGQEENRARSAKELPSTQKEQISAVIPTKDSFIEERISNGFYPFELSDELKLLLKDTFDEESYLATNPDIKNALHKNEIQNTFDHFIEHGISEVRFGKRKINSKIPLISESIYLETNEDISNAYKNGDIKSPFEHFLLLGMNEMLEGTRPIPNDNKYTFIEATLSSEIITQIDNFSSKPLISIIMPVYNVDEKWIDLAIKSLHNQWYKNWELCIADDKSTKEETINYLKNINNDKIKIKFLEKNVNISGASNAALELANGEYIALMDNDDELTADALYEIVKTINNTNADFIYSDEDKLEMDDSYSEPHFKPDFAPDMFLSQNYISHLGVIRKLLIERVGGWTVGLEGSQDYDLYLKVLEHTNNIVHIPKVLYHWRKVPGSTAAEFSDKSYAQEAGEKALKNAIKRRNMQAEVSKGKYPGIYKVEYKIIDNPLVSIIIPFKDKPELLKMCIESILEKSTYKNFEIIGISNNSQEKETFNEMNRIKELDRRINFYEYNVPFNYSDINNHTVNNHAKGEYILLLNNDIEIISTNWIEEMLMHAQRKDIGCVGAKLYYPDDTIQHAGVTMGVLTLAGHNFKHLDKNTPGYMGRESIIQNISAVTAACLMIKKSIYDEVKGLNQEDLKIAFNDVDFCLRVQEKGYKNIYTPYCEAYHYESISRGTEDNPEKVERFNKEVKFMQNRHKDILENGDPFYNINLTLTKENFEIKGKTHA